MAKGSQRKEPRLPSRGRDITEAEKIALAEKVCELYKTDQYTLIECLNNSGINSVGTWYKWRIEIEQIENLYEEAKEERNRTYTHRIKERAQTALEAALTGFTKMVEERTEEEDEKGKLIKRTIRQKAIFIPPKMAAISFVLTNLDKQNFERMPERAKSNLQSGKYDDWTDEEIAAELARLEEEE